ncbi:MAG: hypothetical protein Q8N10_03230 [Phenylobacterium sp.]|uniref:hypothetical protein n=1 Tax=Phenylobacterium sp. TaxID=1871053 RepID=UPI0027159181|nr:hypothetical protein [Phenylobacterium sp.]MDO8912282.1 hypothetical protein [Phenylobacterium sp.]MDP3099494.1 hypothetical protein [Phenylobacterium sp.]
MTEPFEDSERPRAPGLPTAPGPLTGFTYEPQFSLRQFVSPEGDHPASGLVRAPMGTVYIRERRDIFAYGTLPFPISEYVAPAPCAGHEIAEFAHYEPTEMVAASEEPMIGLRPTVRIVGAIVIFLALAGALGNFAAGSVVVHPLFVVLLFMSGMTFVFMSFAPFGSAR